MSISGTIRTRWAALGAAVAVSLGAGGVGLISATSPEGASTFVSINPCRLFDTRPEFQVGPRSAPLGSNDTHTVAGTGSVGDCTIPSDASGLVMNVTTVGATEPTFITVWPAGESRPTASHLNPAPGQPPTPNAVTTELGAGGQFSIYNLAGNVHVLADVVGYYTDHHHDDRYYTKAQVDAAVAEPPVERMLVPLSDFVPSDDQTFTFVWSGSGMGDPSECLFAAPTLPVGRTTESLEIFYASTAAATTLDVGLALAPLTTDPISVHVLAINDDVPAPMTPSGPGSTAFGHVTDIVHDPADMPPDPSYSYDPVVPSGDHATLLQVCFDTVDYSFAGIAINFD